MCFSDRSCLALAFRHIPRGCSRHPHCLLGGGALPDRLPTACFNSSPECGDSRSSHDQGFCKELSSRKLWSRGRVFEALRVGHRLGPFCRCLFFSWTWMVLLWNRIVADCHVFDRPPAWRARNNGAGTRRHSNRRAYHFPNTAGYGAALLHQCLHRAGPGE